MNYREAYPLISIRLYLDEDSMDWDLVEALRLRDIDVISVQEAGTQGNTDSDQLLWATSHNRVLYSHNIKDFCQLHSEFLALGKVHKGIALMPQTTSIGDQVRAITEFIRQRSPEAMNNELIFLRRFLCNQFF